MRVKYKNQKLQTICLNEQKFIKKYNSASLWRKWTSLLDILINNANLLKIILLYGARYKIEKLSNCFDFYTMRLNKTYRVFAKFSKDNEMNESVTIMDINAHNYKKICK